MHMAVYGEKLVGAESLGAAAGDLYDGCSGQLHSLEGR